MNRREFTASLAALVAAPNVPVKAFAAAPTGAAIPPPNLYTWSAAIARTHGKCSAAMLKSMLHVDATQASTLFNRLVANNVVGPANALGFSQTRAIVPSPTGLYEIAQPSARSELSNKINRLLEDSDDEVPVSADDQTVLPDETPDARD